MSTLRTLLLLGTLIPLAACGADDVASPGEGVIVVPGGGDGSSNPPPSPPPAGSAYTGATPAGMIDRGVVGSKRIFELPARLTQDTTIQNLPGAVYQIAGPVNVGTDVGGDGAAAGGQAVTLTVQPGTIFIASAGNNYLVVNRGSRLVANGTDTQPIIFTARNQIDPDLPQVTDSSQGLWGGIVLLGRAPISDCNAAVPGGSANCQNVVEGTTGSLYGGNVANDNSGSLRYVQIRYSGTQISTGNELQGLTLGGVGSSTTIDHIHVHNSSDDGVEIFGGRPNLKYLAVTGADDDSLDTDVGYQGFVQFFLGVQKPTGDGDSHIEADSNGNEDALPRQLTRVSNATLIQSRNSSGGNNILIRGGADYALLNSIVISPQACIDIDATNGTTVRAEDAALQDQGPPIFRSVVMSCGSAFRNDSSVDVATIAAIFGTGSNNNNSAYTPTLTSVFIPGANENVPATDPTTFNISGSAPNRFTAVNFIGAVQGPSHTSFQGWTCNSGYVSFGGTGSSCTALPTT